jgi:hypothetical protein
MDGLCSQRRVRAVPTDQTLPQSKIARFKDSIASKFNGPPPPQREIVIGGPIGVPARENPDGPLPTENRGIKPTDETIRSERLKLKTMGKLHDYEIANFSKDQLLSQSKASAEAEQAKGPAKTGLHKIFSRK